MDDASRAHYQNVRCSAALTRPRSRPACQLESKWGKVQLVPIQLLYTEAHNCARLLWPVLILAAGARGQLAMSVFRGEIRLELGRCIAVCLLLHASAGIRQVNSGGLLGWAGRRVDKIWMRGSPYESECGHRLYLLKRYGGSALDNGTHAGSENGFGRVIFLMEGGLVIPH